MVEEQKVHSKLDKYQTIVMQDASYPSIPKKFMYGTSGFRDQADRLERVCFRMGVLAALRSMSCDGHPEGIVITASHNPVDDNGIKIVDCTGTMLNQQWEPYCEELANSTNIWQTIDELTQLLTPMFPNISKTLPHVFIAYDTRPSNVKLSNATFEGAKLMGSIIRNYKLLTTPQLHFLTYLAGNIKDQKYLSIEEDQYYKHFLDNFEEAYSIIEGLGRPKDKFEKYLLVDGADGVGGIKFKRIAEALSDSFQFNIMNDSTSVQSALNLNCGADVVYSQKKIPKNFEFITENSVPEQKCLSFDGDADRIVYFYATNGNLTVLDGDKLSSLVSTFIMEMVKKIKLNSKTLDQILNIGVVQTNYANYASTKFMKEVLGMKTYMTFTGVKHLHCIAEKLDIGIYFESNGHGTVLFKKNKFDKLLLELNNCSTTTEEDKKYFNLLYNFLQVSNPVNGDAMADCLLIELCLRYFNYSLSDWNSQYTNFQFVLTTCKVKDRTMFVCKDDDMATLIKPSHVQPKINEIVSQFSNQNARAFVRPSGTEDLLRIYAESESLEVCHQIEKQINQYLSAEFN